MRSELDTRTVDELIAADEDLHELAKTWSRPALVAAVVGGVIACRMVDRQLNDLRRQVEALGHEPCA